MKNITLISAVVLAFIVGCSTTRTAEQPGTKLSAEDCKHNCLEDATDCLIGCETGEYPASMNGSSGDRATCDNSCRSSYASCKTACH